MSAMRSTAKKTPRKRAKSDIGSVLETESVFVRFPRPQRNNGKGNEEGSISGIEVMLAIGKRGRQMVYWTTDSKGMGTTAYESLPQLIRERQLTINPLTMHRIRESELRLRREAARITVRAKR